VISGGLRGVAVLALSCLLAACSTQESGARIGRTERATDARELAVTWVGDRDGDGPLLLLMHGYGAPANDLVPLARSLRERVGPSLRIALPGAPIDLGRGRAWWLPSPGPRPADRSRERPDGIEAATRDIVRLLTRWSGEGRSIPERTVIAGFSQGGMLAMEVGLHSDPPLAGIGNLSGGSLDEDAWMLRAPSAPPIFWSHGRRDRVLDYGAAARLSDRFAEAGAPVTWLPFDGGHAIPPVVSSAWADFLRGRLLEASP